MVCGVSVLKNVELVVTRKPFCLKGKVVAASLPRRGAVPCDSMRRGARLKPVDMNGARASQATADEQAIPLLAHEFGVHYE